MPIVGYILTALAAYLLGSIPTGFLVGKARGVDIRTIGSGNIGATNALRALGKTAGILVLLADALKGWLAVAVLARIMFHVLYPSGGKSLEDGLRICAGVSAILGHNYTCWLRFRGGKGIATSAGVLTALVPIPLLIGLAVWIVVFALSRYVSLASICASVTIPLATWATHQGYTMVIVTAALAVLAVCKHRSNIQRLLHGTEHRFGAKAPEEHKLTT